MSEEHSTARFESKVIRQMGQITDAADVLSEHGYTAAASLVRAVTISGDEVKRMADLLDRDEKLRALNTMHMLALAVARDGGDPRPLWTVIAEVQTHHLEPPLPVTIRQGFGAEPEPLTK